MNKWHFFLRVSLATTLFAAVILGSFQLGVLRERETAKKSRAAELATLVAEVEFQTTEALAKNDLRAALTGVKLLKGHSRDDFSRLNDCCSRVLVDQFNTAMDDRDFERMHSLFDLGREMQLNDGLLDALRKSIQGQYSESPRETGIDGEKGESPFRLLSNT